MEREMSRWLAIFFGAMVAIASSAMACAAPVPPEPMALVGATVIPVEGPDTITDSVVLIRDGRIERIGTSTTVKIPEGYKIVDLHGKFVTPGLIDSNAHMVLTTTPEFFVKYEDRLEDIAVQSAEISLKYGITTSGDSWGPLDPLLKARDRIERGEVDGTRLLVAGNIIGLGGPFSTYFMGSWGTSEEPTLRSGDWVHPEIRKRIDAIWEAGMGPNLLALTPEEVGSAMRAYIGRGVDFVKVAVNAHGIGPYEPMMFDTASLRAMRAEARRANIPFQTHTFTIAGLVEGVKLDPDLMQHPNLYGVSYANASSLQKKAIDGAIAASVDRGIYAGLMGLGNTDIAKVQAAWSPADHPGEESLNKIMAIRNLYSLPPSDKLTPGQLNTRHWIDAGVKFTIATDSGPESKDLGPTAWGKLGRAHFERMESLQQVGVKPRAILEAATINGARAYFLGDRTGSLVRGKLADILVVDADPLADIRNLRRIAMVIKEGKIIDRQALPTVKVLDYDPGAPWPY
jgi:imidazolonepropionase-like amidohydrolase